MKRYVVYKTVYTGTLLPPYYIGSTSEEKVVSGKYYGSPTSQKWKEIFKSELKNNKHLFSVEILSYHETREAALEEELRVQILNDVVKSKDYFNESLACKNGFFGRDTSGINNPTYGIGKFDLLVNAYGMEEALIKWEEKKTRTSITVRKNYKEGTMNQNCRSNFEVWTEKYGIEEAEIRLKNQIEKRVKKLKGKKRTEEQKRKMSLVSTGNSYSKGRIMPEDDKRHLSEINSKKNISKITKEFLLDAYFIRNISVEQIAIEAECAIRTIMFFIKKYDIKINKEVDDK